MRKYLNCAQIYQIQIYWAYKAPTSEDWTSLKLPLALKQKQLGQELVIENKHSLLEFKHIDTIFMRLS